MVKDVDASLEGRHVIIVLKTSSIWVSVATICRISCARGGRSR